MCMHCPQIPFQSPLRSPDPTLETTVLNGLSNCCISESHMATGITESTCSEALSRDTFQFLWRLAINTITAIRLRVSFYAWPLSNFFASSGSKRVSLDDKFREYYPVLWKVTKPTNRPLIGRQHFHYEFELCYLGRKVISSCLIRMLGWWHVVKESSLSVAPGLCSRITH